MRVEEDGSRMFLIQDINCGAGGCGDKSICKVLVVQARRPELDAQHHVKSQERWHRAVIQVYEHMQTCERQRLLNSYNFC